MINGPGSHMNAWKSPDVPKDASINIDHYITLAQTAEEAGLSFVFVADGLYINEKSIPHFLNRFEPLTLLSALATATSKIGLVGTLSTSYSEPFTVARQFASLDKLSGGRAGWNVVTSPLEGSASNYNKGVHPEHAVRYQKAEEHLEVVQGLWDSWEDDAFVRDRKTGKFFNRDKMHELNHEGEFFSVKGPLNIERSPQGQPVIFQAGASEAGKDFAAKKADVIFTNHVTLEQATAFYQEVKQKAIQYGRSPDDILIFPSLSPIIGENEEEAAQNYSQLMNLISIEEALHYLGRYFDHYDFSKHPLDEKFPDIGDVGKNSFQSVTDHIKQFAREDRLTLREVALRVATPKGSFFGTYEEVANKMIKWIDHRAADGFILTMPVFGKAYRNFLDNILPILKKAGYYNSNQESTTLREHLKLPFKENRYTVKND